MTSTTNKLKRSLQSRSSSSTTKIKSMYSSRLITLPLFQVIWVCLVTKKTKLVNWLSKNLTRLGLQELTMIKLAPVIMKSLMQNPKLTRMLLESSHGRSQLWNEIHQLMKMNAQEQLLGRVNTTSKLQTQNQFAACSSLRCQGLKLVECWRGSVALKDNKEERRTCDHLANVQWLQM